MHTNLHEQAIRLVRLFVIEGRKSPLLRTPIRLIENIHYRLPARYVAQTDGGAVQFDVPSIGHYTAFLRLLDRIPHHLPITRSKAKAEGVAVVPVPIFRLEVMAEAVTSLEPRLIHQARERRAFLLFDLSGEAVNRDPMFDAPMSAFHRALKAAGIPAGQVILLQANTETGFYPLWAAEHSPEYRIHVLGYHFYMHSVVHKVRTSSWYTQSEAYIAHVRQRLEAGELRPKRFMTLNYKVREHRNALLLALMEDKRLSEGIISYIGTDAPTGEIQPPSETLLSYLSSVPDANALLAHYPELQRLRPITFDREMSTMNGMWRSPSEIDFLIPDFCFHPETPGIDTYAEFLTETYFSDATNLYITEKTLRPFLRLQPFIHLGAPYVLRTLNDMGFATFAPFIDERYDTVEDIPTRMAMALAEIRRLAAMPREELHKNILALQDRLEHNFRVLTGGAGGRYEGEMSKIFNKINTICLSAPTA